MPARREALGTTPGGGTGGGAVAAIPEKALAPGVAPLVGTPYVGIPAYATGAVVPPWRRRIGTVEAALPPPYA
eukprot:CAMPEP_0185717842 /NCGR_PEP_ID=MMETSP1164-20130828/45628_1 /TAXON_ID=1104430 /ORGANISM="Chrysoreinhardia sp, Strain CCMP2950" /LENGTH=72 /DNA_ID=CAMNT_0028385487 /DNA_START=244 /DNA_END=458 /DNA_ORIENTATION=+